MLDEKPWFLYIPVHVKLFFPENGPFSVVRSSHQGQGHFLNFSCDERKQDCSGSGLQNTGETVAPLGTIHI